MMRAETGSLHFEIVKTVLGQITIIWEAAPDLSVKGILLPTQSGDLSMKYPGIMPSTARVVESLAEDIADFLEGEDRHFDVGILDLDSCSMFQRKVLYAEYRIPRGWISTCGRIAKHIGNTEAARAVGKALATNPFPIVIPCHRAVRSNGELGGYQGGEAMKRRLLKMEGIRFTDSGRVLLDKIYY
jgi:methylated-DNA-[protein]-cysteine S-methyltransferase